MNFVGHVVAASSVTTDAGTRLDVLLGAALPDLVPVRHLALTQASTGILLGLDHHRRADAAFHADPRFVALASELRGALEGDGVARGPARAAAHIGVELLIDGELLASPAGSEAFGPVWDRLRSPDAAVVGLVPADARDRWAAQLARLTHHLDPWGHTGPDDLAARIGHVLAPRPRLALPDDRRPALARALADAARSVRAVTESLVADVAAAAATGHDGTT